MYHDKVLHKFTLHYVTKLLEVKQMPMRLLVPRRLRKHWRGYGRHLLTVHSTVGCQVHVEVLVKSQ